MVSKIAIKAILSYSFSTTQQTQTKYSSQPWSFDKHLIVMQRYINDVPVQELAFNKVSFWVQAHDISNSFLTRKVAEILCETVGDTQKSNGAVDEDGGSFFRVRVVIDITLPLCRGRLITLPNGGKRWIKFKYERLPSLCYQCRCLNHDDRDYNLWVQSNGTLTVDQQQFGPSLRALPYKSVGKDVIYVLEYFERRGCKTRVQSRGEDNVHTTMHIDSTSMTSVEAVPNMEVEGSGESLNVEAVNKSMRQRSSRKEHVMLVDLSDNRTIPKNQQVFMANVRSNNSGFLSQLMVCLD